MHILVIGSGGREHTLAWKLTQSSRASRLTVAPGNGALPPSPKTCPSPPTMFRRWSPLPGGKR